VLTVKVANAERRLLEARPQIVMQRRHQSAWNDFWDDAITMSEKRTSPVVERVVDCRLA
jgi:hypothetical protein